MTKAANMIDAGLRTKLAVSGVSTTYTEAGAAGQAALSLQLKRRSRGMGDYQVEFVYLLSDLTIDEEAWRGASITGGDSKVYRVIDRRLTPGSVTFVAERALHEVVMSSTNAKQWGSARNLYILYGVVMALGIGAAVASADVESYSELKAAPAEILTGATTADVTSAAQIANRARQANSNTTVAVSVDFSGAAADTCVVSCLLYHDDGTFLGVQTATATAGAYTDAALDNVAPLLYFDLSGASAYEIRHAAPSAGNVDLRWWAFGARSQQ